jgi:preprotein translocase subunit YajC
MIVMLIVMVVMVYFMMIRPENKRKKEAEATRESIKNGHHVTTIGGIVGIIVAVKEDSFVMETSADRVRIELKKWAISSNDTLEEEKKEAAKKAAEEKAKAKAKKKAAKEKTELK